MPPVMQRIPDLLGGVSQQAPHQRKPNELEESLNAYHSLSRGLGKRPFTTHVEQLATPATGYDVATVRVLDYGTGRRFIAAFLSSELKVWDENGVAQTVNFPDGKTYLAVTETGSLRTATIDRRTFVANREITVARDTSRKAPVQTPRALLYVEQADYATKYEVTVDGTTVSYQTEPGTDASQRAQISTDAIATAIAEALSSAFSSFSVERYGSMILFRRDDDGEFVISARDGLGDNGLRILKDRMQRSADLPLRCLDGFVVEIVGDPESAKDNYWVKFDVDGSEEFRGVWEECARPGEGIALSAATLPHELVYSDEMTPHVEHRGFPRMPTVVVAEPGDALVVPYQDTPNGSDVSPIAPASMVSHSSDVGINLPGANGGPIKIKLKYLVNTTNMDLDETLSLIVSINDGAASATFTTLQTLTFGPGLYLTNQLLELDIDSNVGADFDIKLHIEYSGGVTPDKEGRVSCYPYIQEGFRYYLYTARDLSFPTSVSYPKGTEWTVTVDATPVVYTQTEDMTGAEIAAAIEPLVEAIAGIDAAVVTNGKGTAVRVTVAAGGLPTVSVAASFSESLNLWCPETALGFTGAELDGKTLKNLSDGSQGTVTDCYEHGVTVAALTGGVENRFRSGDLCVVVDSAETFTFRSVAWKDREAGSSVTNPAPSFTDEVIRDVFYHRGRLGFLSGANVFMTAAGAPDTLFRTVTTDLIDSDPIDVRWAGGEATTFHSATPWNGEIVLFGDRVQVVPRGEPVFSPKTIRLDLLSSFPTDSAARPEASGRFVFFGRALSASTQMQALRISPRTRVAETLNLTTDLPTYLSGAPLFFAADPGLSLLFVATDTDRKKLYHLTYRLEDDVAPLYSWGTWSFQGEVLGVDVSEGLATLVMKYSDGIYLETLNLSEGL